LIYTKPHQILEVIKRLLPSQLHILLHTCELVLVRDGNGRLGGMEDELTLGVDDGMKISVTLHRPGGMKRYIDFQPV
jgi:hypothetical protein